MAQPDISIDGALGRYAASLAALSAENLSALTVMISADVEFSDPFHRVRGRDAFMAIMNNMFQRLEDVQFSIHQVTPDPNPDTGGFLHWTYAAHSSMTGRFSFEGVSRIVFDGQGLVVRHEDYWDSAELYRHVPGLNVLFSWLRKRSAANVTT